MKHFLPFVIAGGLLLVFCMLETPPNSKPVIKKSNGIEYEVVIIEGFKYINNNGVNLVPAK